MLRRRRNARLHAFDRLGDGTNVLRRGAAAAAQNVHDAILRPGADRIGRLPGLLVILAHLVRQAGIRIGRDQRIGHALFSLLDFTICCYLLPQCSCFGGHGEVGVI